jgi:hypothetical protein
MSLGTSNNLDLGADASATLKSTGNMNVESTGSDVTIKSGGKIDLNPA